MNRRRRSVSDSSSQSYKVCKKTVQFKAGYTLPPEPTRHNGISHTTFQRHLMITSYNIMSYTTLLTPDLTSVVSSIPDFSHLSCLTISGEGETTHFGNTAVHFTDITFICGWVYLPWASGYIYPWALYCEKSVSLDGFRWTQDIRRGCEPSCPSSRSSCEGWKAKRTVTLNKIAVSFGLNNGLNINGNKG